MPISKNLAHLRAMHANAVLRGDADAARSAKCELTAAKLEEYTLKALAEAPPLTIEQRDRIASLIHDVGLSRLAGGGDAA